MGLVVVLVGMLVGMLVVLLVVVLVVVVAELLLVVLVGRVASEVIVGVVLHEIVGVVLLLAEGVLLLGLLGPNEILVLFHSAGLELIHDLLSPLNLLPPLQRAILRRTHELPLHLLLTREVNDEFLLFVGD